MDDSLAKGLTKRFFRELDEKLDGRINSLPTNLISGKKVSLKNWERFEKAFVERMSPVSLDIVKFGSKKNRKIGWTGFLPTSTNHAQSREENVLYPYQRIYSSEGISDSLRGRWSASHHLIRRFFQRGAKSVDITSAMMMDMVFSELKYVSFWADVLYEQILFGERLVKKQGFEKTRFIIPSKSGYFVAVWTKPCLSLKTFIGLDTASEIELELREKMIALWDLFSPYYLNYRSRTSLDFADDPDSFFRDEFVVYFEMILSHFVNDGFLNSYAKSIIPNGSSDEDHARYSRALGPHFWQFTKEQTTEFTDLCEKYSFIDAVSKTKRATFANFKKIAQESEQDAKA